MSFSKKVLLENSVKFVAVLVLLTFFFPSIKEGLERSAEAGTLDAIAVVMGIVALCSLTGYFSFSFAAVSKNVWSRLFGYITTFLLFSSLSFSLLVIYFIASLWIPELNAVWMIILGFLFIGAIAFDNFDVQRMGKDVAAVSFYEGAIHAGVSRSEDAIDSAISFLRDGLRLPAANALIGKAITQLGGAVKRS